MGSGWILGHGQCIRSQYFEEQSNSCDFKRHLTTHSGEKPKKCNECDNASSQAGHLKTRVKTYCEENQTSATSVILYPIRQKIWGDIWKHTVKKSQTNTSSCAYNLRTHWKKKKKHSGEVKQMQPMGLCIYADGTNLRIHLKTHSGEKLHKCNRCDFASSWANSGKKVLTPWPSRLISHCTIL